MLKLCRKKEGKKEKRGGRKEEGVTRSRQCGELCGGGGGLGVRGGGALKFISESQWLP